MTAVEQQLGYDKEVFGRLVRSIEDVKGEPDDRFALLRNRKEHVAGLFERGNLTHADALRLGMYVTHSLGAGRAERELRMAHMETVLQKAQPGEVALAVKVNGYTGGMLDGTPQFVVDREHDLKFAMDVPFAHMPDDPRLARVYLSHMLMSPGYHGNHLTTDENAPAPALTAMDRLLVGADDIRDYVKTRPLYSLLDRPFGNDHLEVERDAKLLIGLYQAGMTLAECDIDSETRAALYERLHGYIGTSIVPHEQAMHVVTMDRLS